MKPHIKYYYIIPLNMLLFGMASVLLNKLSVIGAILAFSVAAVSNVILTCLFNRAIAFDKIEEKLRKNIWLITVAASFAVFTVALFAFFSSNGRFFDSLDDSLFLLIGIIAACVVAVILPMLICALAFNKRTNDKREAKADKTKWDGYLFLVGINTAVVFSVGMLLFHIMPLITVAAALFVVVANCIITWKFNARLKLNGAENKAEKNVALQLVTLGAACVDILISTWVYDYFKSLHSLLEVSIVGIVAYIAFVLLPMLISTAIFWLKNA